MLASLSEPLRDAMLRDQLSRSEQFTQGLERIIQAWQVGYLRVTDRWLTGVLRSW